MPKGRPLGNHAFSIFTWVHLYRKCCWPKVIIPDTSLPKFASNMHTYRQQYLERTMNLQPLPQLFKPQKFVFPQPSQPPAQHHTFQPAIQQPGPQQVYKPTVEHQPMYKSVQSTMYQPMQEQTHQPTYQPMQSQEHQPVYPSMQKSPNYDRDTKENRGSRDRSRPDWWNSPRGGYFQLIL